MLNGRERSVDSIISHVLSEGNYDGAFVVGCDNFAYLTGIVLPFAPNSPDRKAVVIKPRRGQDWILCPIDWEQAILDQGWKGRILTYGEGAGLNHDNLIRPLVNIFKQCSLFQGRITVDSANMTTLLMEGLKKSLPDIKWFSFDAQLQYLRMIKSPSEIKLLETASRQSEIGIISALQHMEGSIESTGYTLSEFTERVRVHVYEAGGSGVGHMATLCGVAAQEWYGPPRGKFREGELVRIEVTNHFRGYWSNACRMAVIGEPNKEQKVTNQRNITLKKEAERWLKPGLHCRQVFKTVAEKAGREGIEFCSDFGIGHGIGVSEREAPYLDSRDETILQPGMVIVLSIYSYGPCQELICSKDTYAIEEEGCRLLSWYKNWDRLYAVTGFRSAH